MQPPETDMPESLTPKSWVQAIHAYVPGKSTGADGRPLIKLSANENPLGTSPLALAAIAELRAGGARSGPSLYPDPDSIALREAIAACHGLETERIICGTGSDELLNLAAQCYAGPGDEIIHVRYGFSVYDIATRRIGATPIVAPDNNYATDVDAIIASLTAQTRVAFLANPNNPTGTLSSRAEIARLHAALPDNVLLVLDQAYAEYLDADQDDGGLELAARTANILVTRTFSKIHGLAGERIGWGYGDAAIIETLNRIRGPFNVTATGQAGARAALADQDFVERSRAHNRRWREWLTGELAALGNHGVSVVPAHGNFLLALFEGEVGAETVYKALMGGGYIVRWLPGQDLPHALRITIGSEADMRAVAHIVRNTVTGRA